MPIFGGNLFDPDVYNVEAESGPTNNLICDRTGFRVSVKEGLVREWDGKMVRRASFERRNSQDFVRALSEVQSGSTRPEQTDRFLAVNEVQASDL